LNCPLSGAKGDFRVIAGEPKPVAEDLYNVDQVVFLFPALPVTQTPGSLALVLDFPSPRFKLATSEQPLLVRQVHLRPSSDSEATAHLALSPDVQFDYRWAYSRHADVRWACRPTVDRPDEPRFGLSLHVTYLRMAAQPLPVQALTPGERHAEIKLSSRELHEVQDIDQCEALLDRFNEVFSRDGLFLHWSAARLSRETMDRLATAFAASTLRDYDRRSVNVHFRGPGWEWTLGKPVRPTIQFPVAITGEGASPDCGSIAISIT
jgi:hypothetical protein